MTKVGRGEETSIESRASASCEPFSETCQRVERGTRERPFFLRFINDYNKRGTLRKAELEGGITVMNRRGGVRA